MSMTELDTFVKKFHQLWNDGITAHLDLDTHAGDAWVGLRVCLGQAPGPLHRRAHPFHQQVPKKESPSRQRRRARRAAARQANVDIATDAEEANEVVLDATNEQTVEVAVAREVVENTAEEIADHANLVDQINDEFCSNAEYSENLLNDDNSVNYRFIVKDQALADIGEFKSKVMKSFETFEVNIYNQLFEISEHEQLKDQFKFYLKIKNDEKSMEAIKSLKSDNILLMKIPKKKPKS